MECLLCHKKIDEARKFDTALGPDGKVVEDLVGRLKLAAELTTWRHVTLTAQVGGGSLTLQSGHVCPAHELTDAVISLRTKTGGSTR